MKQPGFSIAIALSVAVLTLASMVVGYTAEPVSTDKDVGKPAARDLVLKGDAKCTRCHDETEPYPVLAIGKTRHGTLADGRTPSCTSCHGDSETHINKPEGATERPKPERSFGKNTTTPVLARNESCLACHQGGKRIHWSMSAHASRDLACTTCHQVHTAHDKVRDKLTQSEVCFTCHKEQRVQINRPSHHPIKEGKVACTDCHNPHGTAGEKQLVRDNVNDTCFQCHMEKRGPFVRTHQPVTENCTICHQPHGTTLPNLLKARPPFLCQECHEPTSHRGNIGSLTGTSTGANTLARGCLNCHTNIHGTNNPADISNERTFRR
jgi:DmsE family decaheme c-type cytochrome